MEIEKVSVKLNAFKSMVEAAREHFDMSEYDKAVQIYFTAAKEAVNLYGKSSPEEAQCLRGMADAFYKLDRFIEAKSVLLQLVEIDDKLGQEKSEDAIAARFKLARSLESLQEYDESLAQFKKVAAIAEKELLLGHPLVTTILEAFAHMLRRGRKDPKLLTQIEEKARVSRKKYADPENASKNLSENIIKDLKNDEKEHLKPVWAPKVQVSQNSIFYKSSEGAQRVIDFTKKHPRVFKTALLAPFIVAATTLVISLTITILETKGVIPAPAMAVSAGQKYASIDGTEKLTFLPHSQAIMSSSSWTRTVDVKYARPGWSELLTLLYLSKPGQAWFVIHPEGLHLDTSAPAAKKMQFLYPSTEVGFNLKDRVAKVGEVIKTLKMKKQQVTEAILTKQCQNSLVQLSDGTRKPIQYIFSSALPPKNKQVLISPVTQTFVDGSILKPNSLVVFESEGYFIFGTDENSEPYYSGGGLINCEVSGEEIYVNGSNEEMFPYSPSQIVVATATPAYIVGVYWQLLGLVLWVIAQALVGLKLDSLGMRGSKESGVIQAQAAAQSVMWTGWSLMFMCMMAYAALVLFNIFTR